MGRVDGKRAIVTGSASGMGRATAELLAREGAHVVVADLNEAGAKEVVAAIRDAGGHAHVQHVDIGDPAAVEEMVAASVRELGGLGGQLAHLPHSACLKSTGARTTVQKPS